MFYFKKNFELILTLLLASSISLYAAEDITDSVKKSGQKAQIQAGISPKELVKKSYAYLGTLNNYSFRATIVNEDDYEGKMMLYIQSHYNVSVQRPDKVRIEERGDVENVNGILNNGKVVIYDLETNTYSETAVETNIDDALDTLIFDYNQSIPLAQLLYSDTAEDIEEDLENDGYFFGIVNIDTIPCYYIGFPGTEWDIQLWIEKGQRPVIRRAAFMDKMTKGQPRSLIKVGWDIDNMVDESTFTFSAPKDAKKIELKKIEKKDQK